MLHIKEISIFNFRPYYAPTPREVVSFDFGESSGLNIIIGDNGVGKSSLIKAIKYALYGELETKGNFKVKDEINLIAFEEQRYEFWVGIKFIYNNDNYVLKRWTKIKDNVSTPTSDKDFNELITLSKNTSPLGDREKDNVLKNIIPKNISEFILFEGETIAKYKNLLDSNNNQIIYDSIKKILGNKALENSIIDIEKKIEEYEKKKTQKIKENTKNAGIKRSIEVLDEEILNLQKQYEVMMSNCSGIESEIATLEEYFKQNQNSRDLISQKNKLQLDVSALNGKNDENVKLINLFLKRYKSLAYIFLDSITHMSNDVSIIEKNIRNNRSFLQQIEVLRNDIEKGACNHCGHAFNDHEIQKISVQIDEISENIVDISENDSKEFKVFENRKNGANTLLAQIDQKDVIKDILRIETEIIENNISIENKQTEIKNINDRLSMGVDSENVITEKVKEYSRLEAKLRVYSTQRDENKDLLDKKKQERTNFANKMGYELDLEPINKKIDKLNKLKDIFDESIRNYSIRMREKVQTDATEMFTSISENKEYTKLVFDEYYGLKLYDVRNRVVPNPSDGYRVLLTISLIYGLHKNSSLAGSIILDAPFSTLTEFHRDNIVSSFQKLSPQVILLVYKDQINLQHIREIMHGNLKREFEIYQNRNESDSSYKTKERRIEQ